MGVYESRSVYKACRHFPYSYIWSSYIWRFSYIWSLLKNFLPDNYCRFIIFFIINLEWRCSPSNCALQPWQETTARRGGHWKPSGTCLHALQRWPFLCAKCDCYGERNSFAFFDKAKFGIFSKRGSLDDI